MRRLVIGLLTLAPTAALAQHVSLPPQTFAFEDVRSAGSDLDWNDLVVRWTATCDLNGDGDVVRQRVAYVGVAAGASLDNTLQLRLPVGAPSVAEVRLDGVPVSPVGDVVTLFPSFQAAFEGAPAGFVNTEGAVDAAGIPHTVEILFATAQAIPCSVPAFELVRPDLGAPIDASSRLDGGSTPMAGNFAGAFRPPRERVRITTAYPGGLGAAPSFLAWAADVADGTCDDTCGGAPWWQGWLSSAVDPRDATALEASAPLPVFPTCMDGTQNGDEAGVDCGDALGICGPCAQPLGYDPISNFDGSFELRGVAYHEPSELVCQDHGPYNWMPAGTQYQTLVYPSPCTFDVVSSTADFPIAIGANTGGDAFGWEGPSHAYTHGECEAWKAAPYVDGSWLYGVTPQTVRQHYDVSPFLGWDPSSWPAGVGGQYVVDITCGSMTTTWSFGLSRGLVAGLGNFNLGNIWMFENDFSALSLPSANNDRMLYQLTYDPDLADISWTLGSGGTQLTVQAASTADPQGLSKAECHAAGLIHLADVYGYAGICVRRETVGTANADVPAAPTHQDVSHWVNCLDGTWTWCLDG